MHGFGGVAGTSVELGDGKSATLDTIETDHGADVQTTDGRDNLDAPPPSPFSSAVWAGPLCILLVVVVIVVVCRRRRTHGVLPSIARLHEMAAKRKDSDGRESQKKRAAADGGSRSGARRRAQMLPVEEQMEVQIGEDDGEGGDGDAEQRDASSGEARRGEGKKKKRLPAAAKRGNGSKARESRAKERTRFSRLEDDDELESKLDEGAEHGSESDIRDHEPPESDGAHDATTIDENEKNAVVRQTGTRDLDLDAEEADRPGHAFPRTRAPRPTLPLYMDEFPEEGVGSLARAREVMTQTVGEGLALEVTAEMATWSEERLVEHFRSQAGELV